MPVFVTRTVWAEVVEPTKVGGNDRLVGEMVRVPMGKAPVPGTVMSCGLPTALSVLASWSVTVPVAVGLNVIWMEHAPPPAGTTVPQLLIWEKSPVALILEMPRGALPSLISTTVLGSLGVLSAWEPKLICCGVRATAGAS